MEFACCPARLPFVTWTFPFVRYLLPLNAILWFLGYQPYSFENISNIINSSLLTNSECIGGLKENKVNITSQSECKMHREAQRRQPNIKSPISRAKRPGFLFALTTLRSKTPSLASCNKLTNFVVNKPSDFSWRLGVPGEPKAGEPKSAMIAELHAARDLALLWLANKKI